MDKNYKNISLLNNFSINKKESQILDENNKNLLNELFIQIQNLENSLNDNSFDSILFYINNILSQIKLIKYFPEDFFIQSNFFQHIFNSLLYFENNNNENSLICLKILYQICKIDKNILIFFYELEKNNPIIEKFINSPNLLIFTAITLIIELYYSYPEFIEKAKSFKILENIIYRIFNLFELISETIYSPDINNNIKALITLMDQIISHLEKNDILIYEENIFSLIQYCISCPIFYDLSSNITHLILQLMNKIGKNEIIEKGLFNLSIQLLFDERNRLSFGNIFQMIASVLYEDFTFSTNILESIPCLKLVEFLQDNTLDPLVARKLITAINNLVSFGSDYVSLFIDSETLQSLINLSLLGNSELRLNIQYLFWSLIHSSTIEQMNLIFNFEGSIDFMMELFETDDPKLIEPVVKRVFYILLKNIKKKNLSNIEPFKIIKEKILEQLLELCEGDNLEITMYATTHLKNHFPEEFDNQGYI